jgi:hypothetical protein
MCVIEMHFTMHYRFLYFTDSESECQLSEHDEALRLPSSSSTFCLDLNVAESTVHISRPSAARQDQDETDSEAASSSARK